MQPPPTLIGGLVVTLSSPSLLLPFSFIRLPPHRDASSAAAFWLGVAAAAGCAVERAGPSDSEAGAYSPACLRQRCFAWGCCLATCKPGSEMRIAAS